MVPGCSTCDAAHYDFPLPIVHCPRWSDGSGLRRPEVTGPLLPQRTDALMPCSLSPDSGPKFRPRGEVCARKAVPRFRSPEPCGYGIYVWLCSTYVANAPLAACVHLHKSTRTVEPHRLHHVIKMSRAWRPVRVTSSSPFTLLWREHFPRCATAPSRRRTRPSHQTNPPLVRRCHRESILHPPLWLLRRVPTSVCHRTLRLTPKPIDCPSYFVLVVLDSSFRFVCVSKSLHPISCIAHITRIVASPQWRRVQLATARPQPAHPLAPTPSSRNLLFPMLATRAKVCASFVWPAEPPQRSL